MQFDDLIEILSFKFGLRLPTKKYSIMMIAEQPASSFCAVWKDIDGIYINRLWKLDEAYFKKLKIGIDDFLEKIKPMIKKAEIYQMSKMEINSSSHHSGTARISASQDDGVCNSNGKVHGFNNLYVCDASLIPGSGFANTGLTIAAMAIRMADYFLKNLKR